MYLEIVVPLKFSSDRILITPNDYRYYWHLFLSQVTSENSTRREKEIVIIIAEILLYKCSLKAAMDV